MDGTILDTISVAGETAYEFAKEKKEKNIIKILEEALKVSEIALKETPEKLKILKDNNVVDAGALGYVKILEAWTESLKGITPTLEVEREAPFVEPERVKQELKYKHEVVATFRKTAENQAEKIKQDFSSLGDSLEIIESDNKIKFHIHTNQPETIIEKIKDFPEVEIRTEDMEEQMKNILQPGEKKPLGLVVDGVSDLPIEFLEKYNIEEVPVSARFPDTGEIISSRSGENIYLKMEKALKEGKQLPSTSAPSFKNFISAYNKALKKFEKILVITATSKLSATYSSARIARSTFKKPKKLDIYVFDSYTAEIAEGLVDIKAQELISSGKNTEEIVEELKNLCPKTTLLFCVSDLTYLAHGGRVSVPKVLIKPIGLFSKIGITLVIGLKNSKIKLFGVRFGKDKAEILANEVRKRTNGKEIITAIAHADNNKEAKKLKEKLEKDPKTKVLFVSPVSPVVGSHTGPGALLVGFYHVEKL